MRLSALVRIPYLSGLLVMVTLSPRPLWGADSVAGLQPRVSTDSVVLVLSSGDRARDLTLLGDPLSWPLVMEARDGTGFLPLDGGQARLESIAGTGWYRHWTRNGDTIVQAVFLGNGQGVVVFTGLRNGQRSPLTPDLRMVFDLADRPAVGVNGDSGLLTDEAVDLTGGAWALLSPGGDRFPLWGLAPGAAPGTSISLVLGNQKRITNGEPTGTFTRGRGFTFLPFSIDDRALAVDVSGLVVLPGNWMWIGLGLGTLDQTQWAKTLEDLQEGFNVLEAGPGQSQENDPVVARINRILSELDRLLRSPSVSLDERERLLEQLRSLSD